MEVFARKKKWWTPLDIFEENNSLEKALIYFTVQLVYYPFFLVVLILVCVIDGLNFARIPAFLFECLMYPSFLSECSKVIDFKRKLFWYFNLMEKSEDATARNIEEAVDAKDEYQMKDELDLKTAINTSAITRLIVFDQIVRSAPSLLMQILNSSTMLVTLNGFQCFKISLSILMTFHGIYGFYLFKIKKLDWDNIPIGIPFNHKRIASFLLSIFIQTKINQKSTAQQVTVVESGSIARKPEPSESRNISISVRYSFLFSNFKLIFYLLENEISKRKN
jgi:hypothetical protein